MLPLGHIAAACGTAWLVRNAGRSDVPGSGLLMGRFDYRAVALGAVLPDLVDKPLIWFILRDSGLGGHYVGHSLLFSVLLLAVGLAVVARGDSRPLLVAFGAITHIAYDSITHVPWSILYPFVELDVPHSDILILLMNVGADMVGLLALVFLLKRPRVWERISVFMREGRIEV